MSNIDSEDSKQEVNNGIISRRDLLRMGIATSAALTLLPLANTTDVFAQNENRPKSGRDKDYIIAPADNLNEVNNCGTGSGDIACSGCYSYLYGIVKGSDYMKNLLTQLANSGTAPSDLANLSLDSLALSACQHATVGNNKSHPPITGICASRNINSYYHGNVKQKQIDVIQTYVHDLIDSTLEEGHLPSALRSLIEFQIAWIMIHGLHIP